MVHGRENKKPFLGFQLFKQCKTPENSNFLKKGKIIISIKIWNFSRSWMTKWISQFESSREI